MCPNLDRLQSEITLAQTKIFKDPVLNTALIASVDLGGTKVRGAICLLDGTILAETTEPTDPSGGTAVIQQIASLIKKIARDSAVGSHALTMAVIGTPGVPNLETGTITQAPNIANLDQINFRQNLSDQLGVPALLENDVNLAAVGEHWLGNPSKCDNLVYLSVGTGIGAGIIIDGKLYRGTSGLAGQVSLLPFGADPFEGESLRSGALERVAATAAIVRSYQQATTLKSTVPEVIELANAGNDAAIEALNCACLQIARAIISTVVIVDPEVLVLGGSIGNRSEIRRRIVDYAVRLSSKPINLRSTCLDQNAPILGGVRLAHLHFQPISSR